MVDFLSRLFPGVLVFYLRRPSEAAVAKILTSMQDTRLTFQHEGCTRNESCPPRYSEGRATLVVGQGRQDFDAARRGIRNLCMFDIDWAQATADSTTIKKGSLVAVIVNVMGFWSSNVCRVIDFIDEERRFGFFYGTLPGHIVEGEERFLVTLGEDDLVHFELLAYSRPRHLLAWIGFPFVRWMQHKFRLEACERMKRECRNQTVSNS